MQIETAIAQLRKRKEEAYRVDPNTTTQAIINKLNNNLIGAIADVAQAFSDRTGKTEISNQPKVEVTNFPKMEPMDHSPVVNAINSIPQPKDIDFSPVVTAIKEIPQARLQDLSPVIRAINNLPVPEPVDTASIVKAIKDLPQPEKAKEEVKVTNQIDLAHIEDLLSRITKYCDTPRTAPDTTYDELIIEELKNLALSIENSKVNAVRVLNPGDFPVSPAKAAFKALDGTVSDGLVDSDHHVQVDVLDNVPTFGNNPETEYDYTNPNSIILTQTIGTDNYQQTITISGSIATEGSWIKI